MALAANSGAEPADRVSGLCLVAGALAATLNWGDFTLSWTHSVEKVEWGESWTVTPSGLQLTEARIKGSGAGMEPGPEAVPRDGWFVWRPSSPPVQTLTLARSGVVASHRLCHAGDCRALDELIPGDGPVTLRPCG